jgi:hypothetical protein
MQHQSAATELASADSRSLSSACPPAQTTFINPLPIVRIEGRALCQPRARTGREPETLSCSQMTSKPAQTRKTAV